MKKTFNIFSFGCRVNEAEKFEIERNFILNGFRIDKKSPSISLINTCAVTSKAEREARQLIYQLKRKGTTAIIITGCSATYWKKTKMYQDLPIDMVIDNSDKKHLVDIVTEHFFTANKQVAFSPDIDCLKINNQYVASGRLMLKIQDGCHRFCSYCIVPYLRGKPKSETIQNLETKISHFTSDFTGVLRAKKQGKPLINEVILTAINTECFGKDTKESLTDLLDRLITKTTIPRISFGSIHPWSINSDFVNWYSNLSERNRFVHFFHIPLQSGDNKTLNLMKRGYTTEEFLVKINQLHRINPLAFIATDVIVGFLDETDSDFQKTYSFLEKSPISRFHVFRFSTRNHTAAFYLSKQLIEPTSLKKKIRSNILTELSNRKYNLFLQKQIERKIPALFIGRVNCGFQEALLDNQIPVYVKTIKNLNGEIHNIKVTDIDKKNLIGRLI